MVPKKLISFSLLEVLVSAVLLALVSLFAHICLVYYMGIMAHTVTIERGHEVYMEELNNKSEEYRSAGIHEVFLEEGVKLFEYYAE